MSFHFFIVQAQNYEKSRAKQRKSFLFLPRRSNFAILMAKLGKKTELPNLFPKKNSGVLFYLQS
jgi:hypothetical protein